MGGGRAGGEGGRERVGLLSKKVYIENKGSRFLEKVSGPVVWACTVMQQTCPSGPDRRVFEVPAIHMRTCAGSVRGYISGGKAGLGWRGFVR